MGAFDTRPGEDAMLEEPLESPFSPMDLMDGDATGAPEGEMPVEPSLPLDPFADIDDALCLQMLNEAYRVSKESRSERKRLNDLNWSARHGKFDFINKKLPGQSKIVIPALETSLEQINGMLSSQLVGQKNWFSGEYEGGEPPIPDFRSEHACRLLRDELERLQIEGNYVTSLYGIQQLINDSLNIAEIESCVTWKVSIADVEKEVYSFDETDPNAPPFSTTEIEKRLKIEIVPYDDHYPDPTAARNFDIHEVEVPISALPDLGFDDDTIAKMVGQVSTEKQEQRRVRQGIGQVSNQSNHTVVLREYWGNLIDPTTGKMRGRNVCMMACGNALLVKRPHPINSILWHGRRPWITAELLRTPTSTVHHAFLDIARPLVELESELTNLVIDGGFASVHGVKELRDYALSDKSQVNKGVTNGMTLRIAEGYENTEVLRRVDTGAVTPETFNVLTHVQGMRQEAFRISDLMRGQFPERQESATATLAVTDASNDLFSAMALRFEKGGIEPLLELSWLTMWQYKNAFPQGSQGLPPEQAALLESMDERQRFVVMANGVKFKAHGYKYQLQAVKDHQKLMTMHQSISTSPEQQAIYRVKFSPFKEFELMYRSLGVDPTELEWTAEDIEQMQALQMQLAGQVPAEGGGGDGGNANPKGVSTGPTPNPTGTRGVQFP